MLSTTHISEEMMKYNSVVATHNAMIELGRFDEVKKFMEKQQDIENIEVIKFLEKYLAVIEYFETSKNPDKNKTLNFENPETFKEIITKSLNHIYKLASIIDDNKIKYNKLQDENAELQDEHKELIEQTEELEENIETQEILSKQRIEKVRNICITRNNTIYLLKRLLVILSTHLCVISYYGFLKYYYTVLNIFIGISTIIYNIYYYLKLAGIDLLYCMEVLTIECIKIIPLLYGIGDSLYGFYLLYSSIIYDIINNIYDIINTNSELYTNTSLNMCYI